MMAASVLMSTELGRLIQNQERRILQERPGQGDPLTFAPRQAQAALADQGCRIRRAGR